MRKEPRGPQAGDRTLLQHQTRPRRDWTDDRAGHLAPASRLAVDRQPAGARDDDPTHVRSTRASSSGPTGINLNSTSGARATAGEGGFFMKLRSLAMAVHKATKLAYMA